LNRFDIIVPVYNAEKYIGRCIDSILMQDYKNYELLVIDDCSTDETYDIVLPYDDIFTLHNPVRQGALANIVEGIRTFGESIIVTIDGDDYLPDRNVLSYLDKVYTDDVWMTYGSFIPESHKYKNTCQPFDNIMAPCDAGYLVKNSVTPATYRKSPFWVTSHLRTFRKNLWDKIKDEDLRDTDGEYYKTAWDLAFMYPMIEMADSHCKFIPHTLYVYNDLNPICDGTIRGMEQLRTAERIKAKKEYERIDGDIL
jgi:glycosyltransferase involved in cell wall biosynthesis